MDYKNSQTKIYEGKFIYLADLSPVDDAPFLLSEGKRDSYMAGTRHYFTEYRVESPFKIDSKIFPYPLPFTARITQYDGRNDFYVHTTCSRNVGVYVSTLEAAKQWAARMLAAEYQGLVLTAPIGARGKLYDYAEK